MGRECNQKRYKNIFSSDDRLDSVYGQKNNNRYPAICRSMLSACSRCLSPLLPRFQMGYKQALANPDFDTGQALLPYRYHYNYSGRYPVPSQRQKSQWCRILAGCGPFDKEQHCLCMGTESGSSDIADTAALGRRTAGLANQHEIAPKERRYAYRTFDTDDKPASSMAASKTVSTGRRRLLRRSGRKTNASNKSCFAHTMQCEDFRFASKKKKENTGQTSQKRQTSFLSAKDGFLYSRFFNTQVFRKSRHKILKAQFHSTMKHL